MIHKDVREDQEVVTIGKNTFVADRDFIPLLRELHRVGLIVTQHCAGHDEKDSYLSFELNCETDFWFRTIDNTPRLLIRWNRKHPLYTGGKG